jgi:hypothetical protein
VGRSIFNPGFLISTHPAKSVELRNRVTLHFLDLECFVQWIQYLTQDTLELDMGSIAGSFSMNDNIGFIYRFFIFTSGRELHQPIENIRLQLCDRARNDLISGEPGNSWFSENLEGWYQELKAKLLQGFTKTGEQPYSLEDALKSYEMVPTPFWSVHFTEE